MSPPKLDEFCRIRSCWFSQTCQHQKWCQGRHLANGQPDHWLMLVLKMGYTPKLPFLVNGLEHEFYDFPYLGNFIIPTDSTDFHIFQRGRSTTNQYNSYGKSWWVMDTMGYHGKTRKFGPRNLMEKSANHFGHQLYFLHLPSTFFPGPQKTWDWWVL